MQKLINYTLCSSEHSGNEKAVRPQGVNINIIPVVTSQTFRTPDPFHCVTWTTDPSDTSV